MERDFASPLRASTEQLADPPALVLTAEADVLRDEGAGRSGYPCTMVDHLRRFRSTKPHPRARSAQRAPQA